MKLIKAWNYIKAYLKHLFLKIIYGSKIKIGKRVTWRRNFTVMIDKGGIVRIGTDCFFNNDCTIDANIQIEIGEGSIFGENVKIYDHNHKFNNFETKIKNQGFSKGAVHIGKHCWIGSNVTILKGAYIGDNCVVGAGCVVSGGIENGTIMKQSVYAYCKEKIRNIEE